MVMGAECDLNWQKAQKCILRVSRQRGLSNKRMSMCGQVPNNITCTGFVTVTVKLGPAKRTYPFMKLFAAV